MLMNNNEYLDLVQTIKQEIQQAQYKATLRVNKELIMLYYNIGKIINEHKSWEMCIRDRSRIMRRMALLSVP